MNKIKQIFILAIIAAGAAIGGMLVVNPSGASSVQASQVGRTGIQRWEYCAITSASYAGNNFGGARGIAYIRYFQIDGEKEETVEFIPEFGRNVSSEGKEALSKAIAKLGNDGWEMISKEADRDTNGNFIPIYFKRPKR